MKSFYLILILKMKIQRHQEVKKLAQSPMTSDRQSHTLGGEH